MFRKFNQRIKKRIKSRFLIRWKMYGFDILLINWYFRIWKKPWETI